jgi:hypothetical protein
MKAAYVRLGLISALFLGWLSYLGYLVAERPAGGMVVLSRPQFLISDLDVVANLKLGSNVATVIDVLYPDTNSARELKGKDIKITNLEDCRPPGDPDLVQRDLKADGEYLLALQDLSSGSEEYRVAPTPPSPGFDHGTPRIYPFTKEVAAQYRQIRKK